MKQHERIWGLVRSPKLVWDVLVRGRYDYTYDQMRMGARRMSRAKRLNLSMAGTNLLYRRLTPWNLPLHMQVELTNYCNLRCPVCPTGIRAVNRKPAAIDVDLFKRLMDEVGPYLLTISLWAWGEPLLHPHLLEILRAVRKHDIAILLSTNGQNLNDERIIEALTREPPTHLIVAMDGLTDETNSKFRVGAKLAPILAGVRRIAEIKAQRGLELPVLHMRYIVMKHNQHEVPQLKDYSRSHGFDFLSVRTLSIIDSDSPEEVHQELVPDVEELRAYEYHSGMRIHRNDFICQEPFWFPTVFADGTLVPCEQDYNAQQSLGRLFEDGSFADLWFGKQAALARKVIRDDPQRLSFCRNCPYRDRPVTDASVQEHLLNPRIQYPSLISGSG